MPFFHKSASNSRLQQKVPDSDFSDFSDFSVGLPEPFVQRRLTRQRKLRHLTDRDVGFEQPRSLPDSPDMSAKSKSPLGGSERWSSSPSPQPLPLPELFPVRSPESGCWNSVQGRVGSPDETPVRNSAIKTVRKCSDHATTNVSRSFGHNERRVATDLTLEVVNGNSRGTAATTFTSPQSFSVNSGKLNLNKEFLFGCLDQTPNNNGRGSPTHPSTERGNYNLTSKNSSSKSAPTSILPSPVVSPRTSYNGNHVVSGLTHHEYQESPSNNSPKVPPLKTALSSQPFPLHSPTARSSISNSRPPNDMTFPLHPKLQKDNSIDRSESHAHVNAHPLPLPPPLVASSQASPQSLPSNVHHVIEKPYISSMKGQWQKGKLIGRGTFGSVYLATNRETGALCAMKEVDLIPDDPKSAECIKQLEQEIEVLSHLKHPNIVQYYGSEIIGDYFYIYLEYVYPGSINKYVREHCGAITESIVRNFTRHILSGLAYLHSTKTIHRDIKGANLLVDSSGAVKLADFGMAKHLTGQYDLSLKGSPYWMAPEVIKAAMLKDANPDLALAVDIWSLGCTIIEMLNGKPPWCEFEGHQAMFKVLNKTPPIPEKLSPEGKDFLQCCFQRNPADRPSAVVLLDHPFLRSSSDSNVSIPTSAFSTMKLLEKLLNPKDPLNPKGDQAQNSPGTSTSNDYLTCRSPSTNISSNIPASAVVNHHFSISRTHKREVPHL
ncbi:mitogen-activated protein kinase kinase kinase 5-like isoform X1 [Cucumis melo]|uniref:mitogen-activated protein kinase kinase kinase n=2 Tax=Cucumis melo TaxID=3656 RepID=A0A1S3BAV6_CUCME|nr:mitogen-activated protein kinase kinase kinase 5-like isoform X1 [Cucumis melo]